MRPRPLGCVPASVIAIAIISSDGVAAVTQEAFSSGHPEPGSPATTATTRPRQQPKLVRIPDPVARRATVLALDSAVARFENAGCRTILTDFADADGRPLVDRLTSFGGDVDQYVSMLVFYDGTRSPTCEKGAFAFTAPGSRVVMVCVDQLKQAQLGRLESVQPDYVVAAFIHEILHTLGLGENPPSSGDITRRVRARCGRRSSTASPAGSPDDAEASKPRREAGAARPGKRDESEAEGGRPAPSRDHRQLGRRHHDDLAVRPRGPVDDGRAELLAALAPKPIIILAKEKDYFDARGNEAA
jgi:hypothetical protein